MPITTYVKSTVKQIRKIRSYYSLPNGAKDERRKDRAGLGVDPGCKRAVVEGVEWLGRAQENSLSNDGGVARHFSLISGWSTSYPETTGYIVPTMLKYAKRNEDEAVRRRAVRMLDWLVSIQFAGGGFQGGVIGAKPVVPVTFNTGQILLGLASGVRFLGEEYITPMRRAADWLVETQDEDGCWRKHSSPFAEPGEKVYDTHVAWGLFEAASADGNEKYSRAALANVRWALTFQQSNGWFQNCCLSDPLQPLTHTIGYALRGILEAYAYTGQTDLLDACKRTADGLLTAIGQDGYLPGRLDCDWRGTVGWVCLTGSVQLAYCFLLLFKYTAELKYRNAGYALNSYTRRTIKVDGPPEIRGAVKGAFPVSGHYCSFEFPNWACKFFIDSNLLEEDTGREE